MALKLTSLQASKLICKYLFELQLIFMSSTVAYNAILYIHNIRLSINKMSVISLAGLHVNIAIGSPRRPAGISFGLNKC